MKRRSLFWDVCRSIAGAVLLILILNQWIIKPVRVNGLSMYPTLEDGQSGFSNIFVNYFEEVQRFDIVVLPVIEDNAEVLIVKRVVGLPGEKIEVKDDVLYVDDQPVDEPFFDTQWHERMFSNSSLNWTSDFGPVQLEEDEYYVLGDNRRHSLDSRYYGTFSKQDIVSKDIYILYPFSSINEIRK